MSDFNNNNNINITSLAVPLLPIILAMLFMEAIMLQFFEVKIALKVILTVGICDLWDAFFCHTDITRRYWLRFFYFYHTAFYIYHFR